jgi:hypothetical protein
MGASRSIRIRRHSALPLSMQSERLRCAFETLATDEEREPRPAAGRRLLSHESDTATEAVADARHPSQTAWKRNHSGHHSVPSGTFEYGSSIRSSIHLGRGDARRLRMSDGLTPPLCFWTRT